MDMFTANQVLQGDCTRILKELPSECVDLVLTDPPYGVCYQDRFGRTVANDDDPRRVLGAFTDLYRVLKQDRLCISFYGWGQVDAFFHAWRRAGFRPVGHIVWAKEYASRTRYLNYRHEQAYVLAKGRPTLPVEPLDDIQPWVYSGNVEHPTQKAADILTPLIEAFTSPGQIVLDPFAGSGSTLVAAAMLGRGYLGIELDQRYATAARDRLANIRHPYSPSGGSDITSTDLALDSIDVWSALFRWLHGRGYHDLAGVVESALKEGN